MMMMVDDKRCRMVVKAMIMVVVRVLQQRTGTVMWTMITEMRVTTMKDAGGDDDGAQRC